MPAVALEKIDGDGEWRKIGLKDGVGSKGSYCAYIAGGLAVRIAAVQMALFSRCSRCSPRLHERKI